MAKHDEIVDTILDQKETDSKLFPAPAVRLVDLTDEVLAALFQKGSEPAFNEITKRHIHHVYSTS